MYDGLTLLLNNSKEISMPYNGTASTDVFQPEVLVAAVADGMLFGKSRMIGSLCAVKDNSQVDFSRGGDKATWLSSSLKPGAAITTVTDNTEGDSVTPVGSTMADVSVDLIRKNFALKFSIWAIQEAIRTQQFEIIQKALDDSIKLFADDLDKYAIGVAKSASTAAGNDKFVASSEPSVTKCVLKQKMNTSVFNDRQDEVTLLLVTPSVAYRLIEENLNAGSYGIALGPTGELSRFLGMNVITTSNLGTATHVISSASKTCDVALMGKPGSIDLVVRDFIVRYLQVQGGNDIYDMFTSWAGNCPVDGGLYPVSTLYFEQSA